MNTIETWRSLLGRIIDTPHHRQRIAEALGIHPQTLVRWAAGTSNPRIKWLSTLIDVIPAEHKTYFIKLLLQEYPTYILTPPQEDEDIDEIPSSFYAFALQTYSSVTPLLRSSSMRILIMQQMMAHLDPKQSGIAMLLISCMPPHQGNVRSGRTVTGRSNEIWRQVDHHVQFVGSESQIGQAIQQGRPIITQQSTERQIWFPIHHGTEQSVTAYPILQGDSVAGGISIFSTIPHYFTPKRLDLIQRYVALLSLGFEPNQFVPLSQIELGLIPSFLEQRPLLMQFQQHVMQRMLDSKHDPEPLTRTKAEQLVWHSYEEHFLHLASHIAHSI